MIRRVALLLAAAVLLTACPIEAEHIKEPAVAGTFYPSDSAVLKKTVDDMIAAAEYQTEIGRLVGLVAPHAGYIYSGKVAAHTYRHLKERDVDTVILIGASHHSSFQGASVYTEGSMKTPLGLVKINTKMAVELLNEKAQVTYFAGAFAKEHSLEVQLPFLQETLKDFSIVPVLIGSPSRETFAFLRDKLTALLRANPKAIIVASSDLSHYHDDSTARQKDRKMIEAVRKMAVEEAEQLLRSGEGEMCGRYPVLLTMMVARNLGATDGVLYAYANSGDVTGDKSRVVGYAALGFYRTPLVESEKKELLELARNTVIRTVRGEPLPETVPESRRLRANGSTFVTIKRNGRLRGCIGNVMPVIPLYQSVADNAASSALRDRRFSPMTPAELKDMEIEITILSPLEPLASVDDIVIGRHGLHLAHGNNSAIFLPQVPLEQGWDLKAYLENLALKAGLARDGWKKAALSVFTAEIIQ